MNKKLCKLKKLTNTNNPFLTEQFILQCTKTFINNLKKSEKQGTNKPIKQNQLSF